MSENVASFKIWTEPNIKCKEMVFNHIKNEKSETRETIILRCGSIEGCCEVLPVTTYLLNVCQKFNLLKSDRTTFLSYKDHYTAIELCLTRLKQKNEEISVPNVTKEEVAQCHNNYIKHFEETTEEFTSKTAEVYKTFLEENNCINLWLLCDLIENNLKVERSELKDHLSNIDYVILGSPQAEIFKKLLILLALDKDVSNIVIETPLDVSLNGSESPIPCSPSLIKVYSECMKLDSISIDAQNEDLESATQEYMEDVMIAFLSLLINSRNELSLCKAMMSPIIDFSHAAFTELKHLSVIKEMPMCQTAISYVTKIRLGGKGYAPPDDCPMLPHLKGLELFVDALNHMQTVIEEHSTDSALRKLIGFLKRKLLKFGENKFKPEHIESVAANILGIAKRIMITEEFQHSGNDSQVCEKTLEIIYRLVNYVTTSSWSCDPKTILSVKEVKRTPLNLPPLLGYFRSPDDDDESCHNDLPSVEMERSNSSVADSQLQPLSYFHNSSNSTLVSCVDSKTPTKTNFKDCLKKNEKETENEVIVISEKRTESKQVPQISNNRKRSILGEIGNKNAPKRANKTKEKSVKKTLKTKQQIKGQGKITTFFINGK